MQCATSPWELVSISQDFSEVKPPKVEPLLNVAGGDGYETSKNHPFTLNVTLTQGPEDAIWQASLDNGLEFAFEDPDSAHGKLGDPAKTIKIIPLKDYNESLTRKTHFYITVTNPSNGEKQKVKLVTGIDDTEILITQVED